MSINGFEKIFKALANRRRLAILVNLKREREMTVGHIALRIKLSFTATSRHLVILERAGILEKEQRNKEVFYRIAIPSQIFLGAFLASL